MSSCAAGLRARGYTKRFFPNSEILSLKLTAKSKYSNPNVGRQNPKQSTERLILRFIKISPPLLATNAFHDSNANITFLLLKFSPPSWQLMLFMTQMQILHSFYQHFSPPSWQLMLFMSQPGVFSFRKFVVSEPGVLVSEPGFLVSESGVLVSEPGVLVSEPGVLVSESGRHL